jgi:hypothetical protein
MTMTIDPSSSPVTTGMPAQKKKAPAVTSAGSSGNGPQVFNMAENTLDKAQIGISVRAEDERGIAAIINLDGGKPLFTGDPRLESLLGEYHQHITGEKSFGAGGVGARFAEIGIFARLLPPPRLFDAPDLVELLGDTMCIDRVGRIFVYAPFFEMLLKEEKKRLLAVQPCIVHEYIHSLSEDNYRMLEYPRMLSNIAQDRVVNPMAKNMWPSSAKFSPFFLGLWGLRQGEEKYRNLAPETIGKMMMSEMGEKGTLKIGKLTIVDGKVGQVTTHTAEHGETNDIGDITVTVEDLGMSDKLDTIFDCGQLIIDEIDNQLKPRNRPMPPSGKSGGADKPIKIPNVNPGNIVEAAGEAMAPGNGHMIDDKKLAEGLKKRGYGDIVDELNLGQTPDQAMQTIRESAMSEAAKERSRIGAAYPGSHVAEYYAEVVKPSRDYAITWDRRVKEFIAGTGPVMSRSIDEPGIINFIDAEDMNMTEEDRVYMAGMLPQKPEGIYIWMFDTSGSVDKVRLAQLIALGISARQSADDLAPELMLVGADTVMRGTPQELDDDTLLDIMENGYEFAGRGGTDIVVPLNQIMKWARDNGIKIDGIVYSTDLGLSPVDPEDLPEDLPALMVVALPEDFASAQHVVENLRDVAEVVVIEPTMELNFELAEDRASNRGAGLALN